MSKKQLLTDLSEEPEILLDERKSKCKSPSKKRYDDQIDEGISTTSVTSLTSNTITPEIRMDFICAPLVHNIPTEAAVKDGQHRNPRQVRTIQNSLANSMNRVDRKQTLNDKSERYRSLFPEKWQRRLLEKKMGYERRLRIYRTNPQVEIFYERRLKNTIKVKEKLKKQEKIVIPHFEIDLTFKPSSKMAHSPNSNSKKRLKVFSGHRRKSSSSTASDEVMLCDIVIKVKTVNNIPKQSSTKRIFKEARVTCHLYPDHRLGGGSHKRSTVTNYIPVKNSLCDVQHEFLFKGIPLHHCSEKYLLLELKGKAGNERVVIGTAVVAGTSAMIYTITGSHRFPKPEETSAWAVGMEKMGVTSSASAHIHNNEFDLVRDSTTGSLTADSSSYDSSKSPKRSPKRIASEGSVISLRNRPRSPTPQPSRKFIGH